MSSRYPWKAQEPRIDSGDSREVKEGSMRETPRTIVGLLVLLLLISFSAAAMAAPPCCESRWLFRSFAAFGTSQGSNTTGVFRTAGGELGDYKFHFNDGFGLGLEA